MSFEGGRRSMARGDKMIRLFLLLFVFRLFNAWIVQTMFDPDETWQSLEVAHSKVFDVGYVTWEWKAKIRSFAHPFIFYFLYSLLNVLKLNADFIVWGPKVLQAAISALNDYYLFKWASKSYSLKVAQTVLLLSISSWFNFYFMSRTCNICRINCLDSNTLETTLSTIAFYYYPWKGVFVYKNLTKCLIFAALACITRPTSGIIWVFLCTRLLWRKPGYRKSILLLIGKVAIFAVGLIMCIDYLFYGEWILTPWNFFSANLISGVSEFYGTHPFHWYFSQGFPTILLTYLPWAVLGLENEVYGSLLVWNTVILSFIKHKEFRFLGPMLPIGLLSAGKKLASSKISRNLWSFIICSQLALAFYLSVFHQRGVVDVTHYIRKECAAGRVSSVFFLMPCHSTPFYSNVHYPAKMEFLTCEPPWNSSTFPDNTESLFYTNMTVFIQKRWLESRKESWPSHFVFFENLKTNISNLLLRHDSRYSLVRRLFSNQKCATFFNSHWHDDERRKGNVLVYCRES